MTVTSPDYHDLEPYLNTFAAIRAEAVVVSIATVAQYLEAFDGWYDDTKSWTLADDLARASVVGSRTVAAATDVYLANTVSQMVGRTVLPMGVRLGAAVVGAAGAAAAGTAAVGLLRRGVPSLQHVYMRLPRDYRWHISQGKDPETALQMVKDRGASTIETDLDLAHREQAHRFTSERDDLDIAGYRRVIHPELSRTGKSCGLCVVAADMRYKREDLLPIHHKCKCAVLPIIGDNDPGDGLNRDALANVYGATGGSNTHQALNRVAVNSAGEVVKPYDTKVRKVRVREHGELGPVLVNDAYRFRGPGQALVGSIIEMAGDAIVRRIG